MNTEYGRKAVFVSECVLYVKHNWALRIIPWDYECFWPNTMTVNCISFYTDWSTSRTREEEVEAPFSAVALSFSSSLYPSSIYRLLSKSTFSYVYSPQVYKYYGKGYGALVAITFNLARRVDDIAYICRLFELDKFYHLFNMNISYCYNVSWLQ